MLELPNETQQQIAPKLMGHPVDHFWVSLSLNKGHSVLSSSSSTLFEHDGDPLASADAGRPDAQRLAVPPQLVDEVAADARAGGAERVADGDGTAACVELKEDTQSNKGGPTMVNK